MAFTCCVCIGEKFLALQFKIIVTSIFYGKVPARNKQVLGVDFKFGNVSYIQRQVICILYYKVKLKNKVKFSNQFRIVYIELGFDVIFFVMDFQS